MWIPNAPVVRWPTVERVSIRDFPFEQAILLEECPSKDVEELLKHYRGRAVLLVATAPRTSFGDLEEATGAHSGNAPQDSLVGFLVSDIDRDEDGEVHGALMDMTVSILEEQPNSVRSALIRRWQEECRKELWDGLRASILPEEEEGQKLFHREGFEQVGTCPCCDAAILQWKLPKERPPQDES